MAPDFPSPTNALASRTEVFTTYLDFFRSGVVERVEKFSERDVRQSRLASGRTPTRTREAFDVRGTTVVGLGF